MIIITLTITYNELNWVCMKCSMLVIATQCFIIHFNNIIHYLYGMSTVVVHFGHETAHLTKVKIDVSAQFCWLFSSRKFSESQDVWTPHEFTLPMQARSIDQSYNNERKNICASRSGDQWDPIESNQHTPPDHHWAWDTVVKGYKSTSLVQWHQVGGLETDGVPAVRPVRLKSLGKQGTIIKALPELHSWFRTGITSSPCGTATPPLYATLPKPSATCG